MTNCFRVHLCAQKCGRSLKTTREIFLQGRGSCDGSKERLASLTSRVAGDGLMGIVLWYSISSALCGYGETTQYLALTASAIWSKTYTMDVISRRASLFILGQCLRQGCRNVWLNKRADRSTSRVIKWRSISANLDLVLKISLDCSLSVSMMVSKSQPVEYQ